MGDNGTTIHVLSTYDKVGFIIALIVILLFAVIGNMLVLAVAFKSEKMRTANNYFIFNLAICDCTVGVFSIPIMISSMLAERWLLGDVGCYLSAFLDNMVMIQSTWTLSALSAFRAITLCNPLKFKQRYVGRYCIYLLATLWLIAGLFVAAPCFGWSKYDYSPVTYNCGSMPMEGFHKYFFLVFIILVLFCPLSIVVTSYIIILYMAISRFTKSHKLTAINTKSIHRNNAERYAPVGAPSFNILAHSTVIDSLGVSCKPPRQMYQGNIKKRSSRRFRINQNRSVKSSLRVLLIVGLFLVCVGPLLIISFLMWLGDSIAISNVLALVVYIISLSNSAINPCIYGVCDDRFRKAYRDLFARPRHKQNHSIPCISDFHHGSRTVLTCTSTSSLYRTQSSIKRYRESDKSN